MPCNFQQLPHAGIQTLKPYVPGKSIEALAREEGITDIIKMASNENPLGCSPKVSEALAAMSGLQIASYPAPAFHPIKSRLCRKLGIDDNQLTLGNGSDCLFTLLLTVFGLHTGKHILTHDKAFMTYGIQAETLGIPLVSTPLTPDWQVDIDAMITSCNRNTALLFLANPNNPTGVLVPAANIRQLLKQIPETTIVVLDEAYHEFVRPQENGDTITLLQQHSNLVITRTFSKAYGLAGLRLGYAIAHPEISELLQRAQLPFTVNQAAMTAGLAALEDENFLSETLETNAQGMQQLQHGLEALRCELLPSSCNFITFDCGQNSLPVYQGLLKYGIIVRPLIPYGLPNHLRVSIGRSNQNERFLNTLAAVLAENKE